jgi:hypothetical protein
MSRASLNTAAPTVEAFTAGRDLAFAYIRRAIDAEAAFDDEAPFVRYSTGTLRPFLAQLIAQPELIDGFDAFLTAVVCVLEHSCPNVDTPWLEHGHVYGPDRDWIGDEGQASDSMTAAGGLARSAGDGWPKPH